MYVFAVLLDQIFHCLMLFYVQTYSRYPLNTPIRNSLGEKSISTEDERTFQMLADTYATVHPALSKGLPCESTAKHGAVVHGADIAVQKGALMDYLYFKYGTYMVCTTELS